MSSKKLAYHISARLLLLSGACLLFSHFGEVRSSHFSDHFLIQKYHVVYDIDSLAIATYNKLTIISKNKIYALIIFFSFASIA